MTTIESQRDAAAGFDRPLLLTARRNRARLAAARIGKAFLLGITSLSIMAVLLIFVFIVKEALPFFGRHGLGSLLGSGQWYPESPATPEFGVLSIILGSIYVTAGAMLLAVPAGVLTAAFLSDIVSFRVRQVIKPIIEILAAIPSVAYGFFALLVVAPFMQRHLGMTTGTNILNSAVMLAIMAAPTIISVSEDALAAVGRELREASYALGATRAETIVKVAIPAAHSGIIAAIILGTMRALGETMVVWMASGNAINAPTPWWDLSQSVRTITATVAGEMGETAQGSDHYHALFALGLLLLVSTLAFNLLAEHFLRRVRKAGGATK